MSQASPVSMISEDFGERDIDALAEQMADRVRAFSKNAETVKRQLKERVANGLALRNRNLDRLYRVLAQAKSSSGAALDRIEVERRKCFVALKVDGIVCAYASVEDGLEYHGYGLNPRHSPSGDFNVGGDGATLSAAKELSGVKGKAGLNATIELLGAFVALRLAGLRQDPPMDYGDTIERQEKLMLQ